MEEPILRLKEIIKSVGQLDKKAENLISISTTNPRMIESLIERLNERAASDKMEFRKCDYVEMRSAGRHLYTYRITPKAENMKKEEYDREINYFKNSLPHHAENFMMQHKKH